LNRHAARIAFDLSPNSPPSRFRSIRLSDFTCPVTGSIADRRFHQYRNGFGIPLRQRWTI
jgi:hypothetical protein